LDDSPARVTPRCPHFGPGKCGGCHWQHIDYDAQLDFKHQVVIDQLARVGGFPEVMVHPVIPSPNPWQYRTHVTFSISVSGEPGFIATDDEHIIPIEECHIIRPELLDLFWSLDLEKIPNLERVRLQMGTESDDLLIVLSAKEDEQPELEVDTPASVSFLTGEDISLPMIGTGKVHYTVRGKTFQCTGGAFFQVNLPQAEVLVDQVLARLDLKGGENVLDLYAGGGLFTAFIADVAARVTYVESYPLSVDDADVNLAAYDNIDLIEGMVEDVLQELTAEPDAEPDADDDQDDPDLVTHYDAVVLDPPRAGLEPEALDALAALGAPKIVYVSCDLATFARDAKRLAAKGYTLQDVQPVDLFPQTYHIELVSTFLKATANGDA
jgi:23S rRNA (uracil1939-C5)-methyltransferase